MSIVSVAIIAGATAGLSSVASQVVLDLYKALKSLIVNTAADFDFTDIEKTPSDKAAQQRIIQSIRAANLDEQRNLIGVAEELLNKVLEEQIQLDSNALIMIKELRTKRDIVIEDIELDRRLLEAEKVTSTDGGFRVAGIRDRSSQENTSGPAVAIGNLKAKSAWISVSTIYSMPKRIKLTILGILLGIISIIVIISIFEYMDDVKKRDNFDASIEDSMRSNNGSDYKSSVNYMLTTIPNAIRRTRDHGHWTKFSYSWNKHINRIEEFYHDIFNGLSEDSMRRGDQGEWVCNQIGAILASHFSIYRKVSDIPGIGIDQTAGDTSVLAVFGPVVNVPSSTRMQYIFGEICEAQLSNIIDPPDTRSNQEKRADEIATIDALIAELEKMKSINIAQQIEETKIDFVNTYASYLVGKGMWRADALDEARRELHTVLAGGGYNYLISGMNDIVDRLRHLEQVRRRDLDGEIEVLIAEKQKLEK